MKLIKDLHFEHFELFAPCFKLRLYFAFQLIFLGPVLVEKFPIGSFVINFWNHWLKLSGQDFKLFFVHLHDFLDFSFFANFMASMVPEQGAMRTHPNFASQACKFHQSLMLIAKPNLLFLNLSMFNLLLQEWLAGLLQSCLEVSLLVRLQVLSWDLVFFKQCFKLLFLFLLLWFLIIILLLGEKSS